MSEPKKFKPFAKTFEFFARFVPEIVNKSTGAILYGVDDLLPNNNLRLINDCGVAKRCVRKKARYIQSDGFADEASGKLQVNDNQTADGLLSLISSYAAYYEGFALLVRRNAELKIVDVKSIPFQCVRKNDDGTFIYNPTKGSSDWKRDKDVKHPAFRRNITKKEFAKQLVDFKEQSEILYVYEQTADNPHYPVPDYNAGIEDIKTCIEIQLLDLECAVNGFIVSAILTTQEIDNENKDEEGKTARDRFDEEMIKFTGRGRNKEGNTGRWGWMHVQVANMAEAPKLESFDPKPILEASNAKRDVISRAVCTLNGVHPVLVGFSDAAILGNQQAIANVITEMNNEVNPIQRMISNAFQVLYPDNSWTISQFNPIRFIPPEVWATLTEDEKRDMVGKEPLPKDASSESENTLNSLNSVPALVANKILDNMTADEMRGLIGLPPLTEEQKTQLIQLPAQPAPNGTH